jgi:hypothetical protein
MFKLQFYGVNGKTKQRFQPYLNNRYLRTQVLGPLLFLIYINDSPEVVNDKTIIILFADDTTILVRVLNRKDFHNNMIDAFTCVYNWFRINLLSLNTYINHIVFSLKQKTNLQLI